MSGELQFDDETLDTLAEAQWYIAQQPASAYKKDDDLLPTAPHAPVGVNYLHSGSKSVHRKNGKRNFETFRCVAIGCVLLCLVILSLIAAATILSKYGDHRDLPRVEYTSLPSNPVPQTYEARPNRLEIYEGLSEALEFVAEFNTTNDLRSFVPYPLDQLLPDFDFNEVWPWRYEICCTSKTKRFFCGSGYTSSGDLAFDAFIGDEEKEGRIKLYMWVNRLEMLEIVCDISGALKPIEVEPKNNPG